MSLYIKSDQIILVDKVYSGVLEIEGQYIKKIHPITFEYDNILDYSDKIIAPGLIDIHTHGYGGYGFSGVSSYDDLNMLSKIYASLGVTAVLATTSYNGIDNVVEAIERGLSGADILGIHLEGPFLNPNRFGAAAPGTYFPAPDMKIMNNLLDKNKGNLKMMTIAAERDGSDDIIKSLKKNNVIVAVGHTEALYSELEEISEDIDVMTHLGNASSGISHRDMGTFGYGLNTSVMSEIIADFRHLQKPMLEIIFKIKSKDEIILISDSIALGGCPKGEYDFISGKLFIDDKGVILNEYGHISGSSYPMIKDIQLLHKELNISLNDLFKMGSLNPSKLLKIDENYGSIKEGKIANIIILDHDLDVLEVFKEGTVIYESTESLEINPNIDTLLSNKEYLNFYANKEE